MVKVNLEIFGITYTEDELIEYCCRYIQGVIDAYDLFIKMMRRVYDAIKELANKIKDIFKSADSKDYRYSSFLLSKDKRCQNQLTRTVTNPYWCNRVVHHIRDSC